MLIKTLSLYLTLPIYLLIRHIFWLSSSFRWFSRWEVAVTDVIGVFLYIYLAVIVYLDWGLLWWEGSIVIVIVIISVCVIDGS